MKKKFIYTLLIIFVLNTGSLISAGKDTENKLGILWTSGDPAVAKKMVMIYVFNAKKQNWFETVRLIIWGPSAKLAVEDTEIREWISKLKDVGVELTACKWCADSYGVSDKLRSQGVDVIYYGKPLSDMIKEGWKILTL